MERTFPNLPLRFLNTRKSEERKILSVIKNSQFFITDEIFVYLYVTFVWAYRKVLFFSRVRAKPIDFCIVVFRVFCTFHTSVDEYHILAKEKCQH